MKLLNIVFLVIVSLLVTGCNIREDKSSYIGELPVYEVQKESLSETTTPLLKIKNKTEEHIVKNENTIIMFHNGRGPMCIEALEFINGKELHLEEHLTYENDFNTKLNDIKEEYLESEGVSTNFGYLPIIIFNKRVYSGFDDSVRFSILEDLELE